MKKKLEQLDLFPEQPKEVKELLQKMDLHEKRKKEVEDAHEFAMSCIRKSFRELRYELQKICIHPVENQKKEIDFDYHKREETTTISCDVCGKILDSY